MFRTSFARPRLAAALGFLVLSLASGIASAGPSPFTGVPAVIPGIIQAENFDRGGERVAYHDRTAANIGGKYRLKEAVDIIASPEAGGGSIVSYFDTGEWLVYTVTVTKTGYYDIEMRACSAVSDSAYHIEIDAHPLTTWTNVPNTGSWNTFQWVGKRRAYLTAGRHLITVGSDQQYFGFDALRFTAATDSSTPYAATPVAVPGIIEAENYDRGGEGVSYHDTTAGNIGGQYRGDDVDLLPSTDTTTGGYIVSYFEAGEWVIYTIDAATAGDYDLEVRASAALQDSAYHVEIDGQAVTGRITVPNMGSWDVFQWIGKQRVALTAGRHLLKVVSEQPYFGFDAIRLSTAAAAAAAPAQSGPKLLFSSGFEGAGISVVPPLDCWGTGCWQDLVGMDSVTGQSWPASIWGGGGGKFLMLSDPVVTSAQNIGNYLFNRVDSVTGHTGAPGKALYQQITQNNNGTGPMGTAPIQTEFQFTPTAETSDLYVSYWLKLQPDLVAKMTGLPAGPGISNGGTWRAFFSYKTGGRTTWNTPADNGDYRVEAYVVTTGDGQLRWMALGDNNAGGGAPLTNSWTEENREVPVPVGVWFKFEAYWHRSAGSDGRVWMAANGQPIVDHHGPNTGAWNMPINRVMAPLLYSGSAMPIYQWIDDLEIRDGFPASNGNNQPYAPH